MKLPTIAGIDFDNRRLRAAVIAVGVLVIVLCVWLTTTLGPMVGLPDTRVAARVNGTNICEGDVTNRVTSFRYACGLATDKVWRSYLEGEGLTSSDFRSMKLDELVHAELIRQAAAKEGVSITDEEVQAKVQELRQGYEDRRNESRESAAEEGSATSEGATLLMVEADENDSQPWEDALAQNGYDEDTFSKDVQTTLLEEALANKIGWGATYGAWIQEFEESCDIEIMPMPDGLPYAI